MSNISHIILASSSPRRQQLMKEAGIAFEVRTKNTDEVYPSELKVEDIPVYLGSIEGCGLQRGAKSHGLLNNGRYDCESARSNDRKAA